jgi:hypothetical protein
MNTNTLSFRLLALVVSSWAHLGHTSLAATADSSPVSFSGYEVPNLKDRVKDLFPGFTGLKKSDLLPQEFGGTSFTGLVSRLLGEALNRQFEGLNSKQIIYYIEGPKNQTLGLVHTATSEWAGQLVHTILYYSPGGTVKRVEVDGLPQKVAKEFSDLASLEQFKGHQTEDFEVIRGRKGRIVSKGTFLAKVRRPKSAEAKTAFEKVLRSVRFSAAFMDVAYFITQHPDQADQLTQEFPEGLELTGGMPSSGPEAFVDKKNIASPIDGKPFHPETESSTTPWKQ